MRRRTARLTTFLFTMLLFISIYTSTALAADFKSEITLEGNQNFSLTASSLRLFDFENIAPGDVRTGQLHIKNTTDRKMECRILSVTSYAKDRRLFDAMRLRITDSHGNELYNGSYGCNDSKPLASITVKPQLVKVLNVEVTFPANKGNEYQSTEMDSIWTFEARIDDASTPSDDDNKGDGNKDDDKTGDDGNKPGENNDSDDHKRDTGTGSGNSEKGNGNGSGSNKKDDHGNGKDRSGVKTGQDLTLSDSGLLIGFILVGLCFFASIVTSIRIYAAKRKRKEQDRK